jgi:hypothetical protein
VSGNVLATPDISGFRDFTWGMDFNEVKRNLKLVEDHGDIKYYTKNKDDLKVGTAILKKISYGFYKGKFFAVNIKYQGIDNHVAIKEILGEKYGGYMRFDLNIEKFIYGYKEGNTQITVDFNQISENGFVIYLFKELYEESLRNEKDINKKSIDLL